MEKKNNIPVTVALLYLHLSPKIEQDEASSFEEVTAGNEIILVGPAGHPRKAKKGARHLWIGISQAGVYIPPLSDILTTHHRWMQTPISSPIAAYCGPALTVAMKGHGATKRGPAALAEIGGGGKHA
ncbi:hypothetical protein BU17DRAFT_72540 [Hysterangium stoloniferum]|nr:hypothetical protein BU17DRAFT_72540 [Hysterangium stoloniferum]